MPSLSAKMKILLILAKIIKKLKLIFSRNALFCVKTRASLKHFVDDYLWKQLFASNSPLSLQT